jgi:ribosomal protein S18 acetylase RimI-like enzyme
LLTPARQSLPAPEEQKTQDLLRKIPFTEELLEVVQTFDCGGEEWEKPLNAWIKAGPDVENGALFEMNRAARNGKQPDVWLHINGEDKLVGYSSLGETNWRWPQPTDPRVPISVIPYVAVQKRFQGKPPEPPRDSKQIIDHLVFEAGRKPHRHPLLGLYVDPRNTAAVKVYRREGFVDFKTYTDPDDGITYQGMILKLEDHIPFVAAQA